MSLFKTDEEKRQETEELRGVKDASLSRLSDTTLIMLALSQIMWQTDCAESDQPLMDEMMDRILEAEHKVTHPTP